MNSHAQNSVPTGSRLPQNEDSFIPCSSDNLSSAEPDSTSTPQPRASLDDKRTVPDYDSTLSQAASLPRIVGKYVILEEVQSGGMGIVFKARDTMLDRIVALKIIKGGLLATAEEIARFHHEARSAASLDHPNIVPVYEIGQEEGRLYFTMAFAWGGSLAQQQDQFVADPRAAVTLLEKVARAVHYAHQNNIWHRDLKPANILFDERGTPWVSDFGLAKVANASLELTRTGQLLGTPAYMAPEQASGHTDQVSAQTDVWALGVLLYELLTGHRPFKGDSQEEQLRKVQTAEPRRPRTVNRSLDRVLETVILKCLEKEPGRRYPSAEALADDLGCWLRGEPTQVQPPGPLKRAWLAVRRHSRITVALVLLAVLALTTTLAAYRLDPERPLRNIEGRLERGQSQVLIGETGKPLWYSFAADGGAAQVSVDNDGTFSAHSWMGWTLVELVRDPRQESYRLRAEVRQLKGNEFTHVGLYVLHRPTATPRGTAHSLLSWIFDDCHDRRTKYAEVHKQFTQRTGRILPQKPPKGNPAMLCSVQALEKKREAILDILRSHVFEPAIGADETPWRSLAIEVTPRTIRSFWDGQLACELPFADLVEKLRSAQQEHNRQHPDSAFVDENISNFSPRGGLGLFVSNGSASFRRVVIEPLNGSE